MKDKKQHLAKFSQILAEKLLSLQFSPGHYVAKQQDV